MQRNALIGLSMFYICNSKSQIKQTQFYWTQTDLLFIVIVISSSITVFNGKVLTITHIAFDCFSWGRWMILYLPLQWWVCTNAECVTYVYLPAHLRKVTLTKVTRVPICRCWTLWPLLSSFGKQEVGMATDGQWVRGFENAGRPAFSCTCSCTSAAPSWRRCECASPAAAAERSGPRWVDAAGSARWRNGPSSHRRPEDRGKKRSGFIGGFGLEW